jgi:PPOX class probable FMN-dependent enzyme
LGKGSPKSEVQDATTQGTIIYRSSTSDKIWRVDLDRSYIIQCPEELSSLYGPPLERSVRKQIDHLDDYCRTFIGASPLVIVSTQNGGAADASPRGDFPGFVRVADEHTLLIPDRRGNNRLDTLKNLVDNPAIGLLFLVPGRHETFRVNGEAVISRDPALTSQFLVQDKAPRTVIVVTVKEAYIQCSRALVRADLWNPAKYAQPGAVPTMGQIMAAHTCGFVEAQTFDEEARARVPATLY